MSSSWEELLAEELQEAAASASLARSLSGAGSTAGWSSVLSEELAAVTSSSAATSWGGQLAEELGDLGESLETHLLQPPPKKQKLSSNLARFRKQALEEVSSDDETNPFIPEAPSSASAPLPDSQAQSAISGQVCAGVLVPAAQALARIVVDSGALQQLSLVNPLPPVFADHVLGPHLLEALKVATTGNIDPDPSSMVDFLCHGCHPLVMSKSVLCQQLGLSTSKVTRMFPRVAAAMTIAERAARSSLERAVVSSPATLVCYVELARYDETPMRALVKEEKKSVSEGRAPRHDLDNMTLVQLPAASQEVLGKSTGVAKILQTESKVAILYKTYDSEHCPSFSAIVSDTLNWVQILDRNSSDTLRTALKATNGTSRSAQSFPFRVRVASTDAAASNTKAERDLVQERPGWSLLHFFCEVHTTSRVHTAVFHEVEGVISGSINLALSLGSTAAMNMFRAAVKSVVASSLDILRGEPEPGAKAFRNFCLNLFLCKGSKVLQRQVLLTQTLNGDWRSRRLQHFVPHTVPEMPTREALVSLISDQLISAVASKQPSCYPRHRWTGADISIAELGLMEACHGLLTAAYLHYTSSKTKPSPQDGTVSDGIAAEGQIGADFLLPLLDEGHMGPPQSGFAGPQAAGGPNGVVYVAELSWPEQNARFQATAVEFLRKPDTLALLMLTKTVMGPLSDLLTRQLYVSGKGWEREQQLKQLKAAQVPKTLLGARQYRVLIAASCELENQALKRLREMMFQEDCWVNLPAHSCTLEFQALAFRMLSKASAALHEGLKKPHTLYPFSLFRLLEDPGIAVEINATPMCVMDGFSQDFFRVHSNNLISDDALFTLLTIAHTAVVDIAPVEASHAALRRLLQGKSLQTHLAEIGEIAAQSLFAKFRNRSSKHLAFRSRPAKPKASASVQKPLKKKSHQRHVSAYNCFCREYMRKNGPTTFQAAAAAYKVLPPNQKAQFQRLASICKTARRFLGKSALGVKPSVARRKAQTQLHHQQWQHSKAVDGEQHISVLCDQAAVLQQPLKKTLQTVRRGVFNDSLTAAAKMREDDQMIGAFRSYGGKPDLAAVLKPLVGSNLDPSAFAPVPSGRLQIAEFTPDSATVAGKVFGWANSHAHSSNLSSALAFDWSQKMTPLQAQQPLDASKPKRKPYEIKCVEAGRCLCSATQLLQFRLSLFRMMANSFTARAAGNSKSLLVSGRVVLELQFVAPEQSDDLEQLALPHQQEEPEVPKIVFWHVAFQSLSPFRPTIQPLSFKGTRQEMVETIILEARHLCLAMVGMIGC